MSESTTSKMWDLYASENAISRWKLVSEKSTFPKRIFFRSWKMSTKSINKILWELFWLVPVISIWGLGKIHFSKKHIFSMLKFFLNPLPKTIMKILWDKKDIFLEMKISLGKIHVCKKHIFSKLKNENQIHHENFMTTCHLSKKHIFSRRKFS